jgi:hypothetical protein
LLWGAGCATSDEDAAGTDTADEDAIAVSSVQLAPEDQIQALGLDALGGDATGADVEVLFGCSNRQIRIFQAACRQVICGSRGSNGIHFCDQRPPNVVAQCDCRSGADPMVTCSLADCPQ